MRDDAADDVEQWVNFDASGKPDRVLSPTATEPVVSAHAGDAPLRGKLCYACKGTGSPDWAGFGLDVCCLCKGAGEVGDVIDFLIELTRSERWSVLDEFLRTEDVKSADPLRTLTIARYCFPLRKQLPNFGGFLVAAKEEAAQRGKDPDLLFCGLEAQCDGSPKGGGEDPVHDSAVPQGMRPEYLRARREVLAEIRSIITDMENE